MSAVWDLLQGWAAILVVLAVVVGAYRLGHREGRVAHGRDLVRAAVELETAKTVPILVPRQRRGEP
ncbi:hypothetical protein [Actinoplanes sp. NPDC051494]|uniref:hypothetical protein n=1 Tax=Actinoplanes sp. NPDC051494 TaxID=3363907 RepID=UPI0037ABFB58